MSVLPTMKTPAFQKHRSRVEQVEEAADNVGDPVSQPLGLNQVSKPATDVSLISGDTIETTDPGMVDVTNTVRKSTRSRAKKKSVPSKENAHESFPAVPATTNPKRTTRACARKRVTKEVVADDLEAVPATATRRTTRTRTKKAETGSGGQGGEDSCLVDTVATSSRRMTRSRINSAASVESQTGGEKEKPVMASKLPVACRDPQNGDSPMSTQSVGPDRNQVPIECSSPSVTQSKQKVSDDIPDLANLPPHTEEPTGKGLSQNGSAKTLDLVTAEKLQVSSPAIETSIQLMETEETTTAGQTLLPVPVASDVAPPVRRSTRLFKRAPGTPDASCTSDTDDEGYIRPPPPKRSLLKLKKKKGKEGSRKGKRVPRKVEEDAVKTDVQSPTSSGESVIAVADRGRSQDKDLAGRGGENDSTPVTEQPQEPVEDVAASKTPADGSLQVTEETVQTDTQSSDTMYESCISEVESGTSSKPDTKASRRIPRRAAKAAKVRGRVKTPVGGRTEPEERSLTAGPFTPKQPHTPRTPGTYTRPRPVFSPMNVPYLSNTPRVLRQLHEEHQARSGGKIISLAELRSRNRYVWVWEWPC